MTAPETAAVLSALGVGETNDLVALFVGGCVRDSLLARDVGDIDIATALAPEEVTRRLCAADIKVVPTGLAHGTVTAVVDHRHFEITTLRDMGGDRDDDGVVDTMTSLRDRRGALVELDIILNGVWYNEGMYDGSGNLPVYGSILMKEGFAATGSPNIFYNEGLVLGDWPPAEMLIPRVYVSHVDVE